MPGVSTKMPLSIFEVNFTAKAFKLKCIVSCKMKIVTSHGAGGGGGSEPLSLNDTGGSEGVQNSPKSVTYFLNGP